MNVTTKPINHTHWPPSLVLWCATLVLLFWFIIDPLWLGFGPFRVNRDGGPFKYLIVLFGIVLCTVVAMERGKSNFQVPQKVRSIGARGLPLALFSMYAFTGSLYARFELGIQESFLQFGLAPIAFFIGSAVFMSVKNPEKCLRFYIFLLWVSLIYVVPVVAIKRLQHGQAFHTEIFLFAPLILHAFMAGKTTMIRWAGASIIVVTTLLLHKNLGYLCMAMCMLYTLLIARARRPPMPYQPAAKVTLILLAATLMLGMLAAAAFYIYSNRTTLVPSGNTHVRTEIYAKVFNLFLSSPFFGDGFTGSVLTQLRSVRIFGTASVTTHSDWLDTLAHGGALGIILFVLGIGVPLCLAIRDIHQAPRGIFVDQMHILIATVFCGLLVGGFVSLFNSLPLAFAFWLCLGSVSAGVHRLAHS
jgi:hypothetical protein